MSFSGWTRALRYAELVKLAEGAAQAAGPGAAGADVCTGDPRGEERAG